MSCGGGQRSRSRSCTKPEPQFGGRDCIGSAAQTDYCNSEVCPSKIGVEVESFPGPTILDIIVKVFNNSVSTGDPDIDDISDRNTDNRISSQSVFSNQPITDQSVVGDPLSAGSPPIGEAVAELFLAPKDEVTNQSDAAERMNEPIGDDLDVISRNITEGRNVQLLTTNTCCSKTD